MSSETFTSLANTTGDAVQGAFAALSQPHPALNLTKHYKGITLDQTVRLLEVDPHTATIQATQRQVFPCLEGTIHLRSAAFPGAITAQIQPLDYSTGMFLLTNLSIAQWCDRQTERVQPRTPIYIVMRCRRTAYRAFLEDISVEGMGILASQSIDPAGRLRVGTKISLDFYLVNFKFNQVKGFIVYRQKIGRQLMKFGLHIYPTPQQKHALQSYLIQRHDEILDELAQNASHLGGTPGVEKLYF